MSMKWKALEYLGACQDLRYGKLNMFARHVGVCQTSIIRDLRADGARYSDLLDAERKRRCVWALEADPEAKAETLAKVIGYSGSGSVHRAMKRWFGVTITQWRST